jgi:hypothetical protein
MANTVLGEKREGDTRIRSKGGIALLEETYVFLVESDDKNNSRINILSTAGLPVVGVTVSAFGYTVCRSKSAKRRADNPILWDVTCEFSSEVEERQDSYDPTEDPEAWIPIYETRFERYEKHVTIDLSGDPVVNSAGGAFPNGLTIGRFIPVWEFFQFEADSITDFEMVERIESVNAAAFKGGAEKTWLLTVLSSVVGYYYGARRRLNQYSLKYNPNGWTHTRLDEGEFYLDGDGNKVAYTTFGDDSTTIIGPLNGFGARADVPSVLEFDIYPAISFSFLRI